MKFTMFVRPAGNKSSAWREDYDLPHVLSMEGAIMASQDMIADWNVRGTSKRRRHNGMIEKAREIIAVEFGDQRTELS